MKKHLLFFTLAFASIMASGQIVIPNGGFEKWTTNSWDYPDHYPNNSNTQNFLYYNLPVNVTKTTDAYHGTYAVQLSTVANATDTSFAYFIDINPNGDPSKWTGATPYSQRPKGLRGYYKYNVANVDSATLLVVFSKAGVNIGTYYISIGGIHSTYTLFDITFNPALAIDPDSVSFGAVSCKLSPFDGEPSGPAGSTLILDSVSFTGVASQPALFNGDFESWQSQTFYFPDSWNIETRNGDGFKRTTDAQEGSFAMELFTYLGDQNNSPAARAGYISTGYYPNNCNGDCQQLGGIPFNNQKDTLAFYYKYEPVANDTAAIYLSFKKDGNKNWGTGIYLLASATYKYVEIPFDLPQAPDTVLIDIQSSLWNHLDLSYVGSSLVIDNLHFKTKNVTYVKEFTSIDEPTISPNPTTGSLLIKNVSSNTKNIDIYNETGERMLTISKNQIQKTTVLNISDLPKGIYFVRITENGKTTTQKMVKE